MSRAVAAFVAIWQNASAGVLMLIACQCGFSTGDVLVQDVGRQKLFLVRRRGDDPHSEFKSESVRASTRRLPTIFEGVGSLLK